jgi:uncharacterized damage-inducible protein DinB
VNHSSLQILNYHIWANEKYFQHLKDLPQEICHTEIRSVFPTIYETLVHMLSVDSVWLHGISGESYDVVKTTISQINEETKGKSVKELEPMFFKVAEAYKAFFNRQQDMDSATTIHHPAYGSLQTRYSDLVQHVVNHGTYHRGNITAMLRQLGHPGPSTDYIHYLYSLSQK